MSKPISSLWLGDDKGTDRIKSEEVIRNNIWLLGRLREIILSETTKVERSETSLNTYETPNWQFKQAHLNGMRQAYNEILKLTDFLK